MSAYMSIPRDLTKVKTKVFLNLTKRQIICFGLAALVGVPLFFLLKSISPNISFATLGMLIVCMPFFLFAMFERTDRTLKRY
jgi:F0F1-type ATP synthase assembly protein I